MRYLALLLLFAACHAPVVPPPPDDPRKSGNVFGAGPLLGAIAGPSYAPVVNTSLDSVIKTQQILCGVVPTALPATPLTGRGTLIATNTGAEVWIGECSNMGVGLGTPLIAGASLAAPGGTYSAAIGPDVSPLCCAAVAAQTSTDAGPATCTYETTYDGGPFDAGPGLDCVYDAGVCADGGTSCLSCQGTCAADGGPNCPSVGILDGGPVHDGGCVWGGVVVQEFAR